MDGAIDPIKFPPFSMGVQSPGGVKYPQGRGGVGEGKEYIRGGEAVN